MVASVSPERGSSQSSSTRFHGQSSTIFRPGNLVTASTTAAACRDVREYWLCSTYTIFEDDGLRDDSGDLAFFGGGQKAEACVLLHLVSLDEE